MKNTNVIVKFLTPSWLTNFVGISLAVLISGAVIVLARYQGSQLHQEIFAVQSKYSTTSTGSYHGLTNTIAHNHVLSVAPLFIVWACVGLAVYYFTIAIVHAVSQAADLREELNHVNVSRRDLLRQAFTQLAVRITALLGWFGFIKLSISYIVPYALTLANIAGVNKDVTSITYGLLTATVMYADIYGHSLFLRLITLRLRLFGS